MNWPPMTPITPTKTKVLIGVIGVTGGTNDLRALQPFYAQVNNRFQIFGVQGVVEIRVK
jgi:hypothetical protein